MSIDKYFETGSMFELLQQILTNLLYQLQSQWAKTWGELWEGKTFEGNKFGFREVSSYTTKNSISLGKTLCHTTHFSNCCLIVQKIKFQMPKGGNTPTLVEFVSQCFWLSHHTTYQQILCCTNIDKISICPVVILTLLK